MLFTDFKLSDDLQNSLAKTKFKEATEIQEKAIPHALMGVDVLGIAQTGTGKTLSFLLPIIHKLENGRVRARMPRSLILTPTRELAIQIKSELELIANDYEGKNLNIALLIGGVSFVEQDKIIDRGADILIATPGRLLDHFSNGKLLLSKLDILVVDEADRMLDMGFIPDIEQIFKLTPPSKQTLFFSATMPKIIQRLVDSFLKSPVIIEASPRSTAAKTIEQKFIKAPAYANSKREVLRKVVDKLSVKNAIIFCNKKKSVSILYASFRNHGYKAAEIHGDLDQSVRNQQLQSFKDREVDFLIASDVAARGIDIPDVAYVINYDLPINSDDYIHRIGRTGRAGEMGASITLVTSVENKNLSKYFSKPAKELSWLTFGEKPSREKPPKSNRDLAPNRAKSDNPKPNENKFEKPKNPNKPTSKENEQLPFEKSGYAPAFLLKS